MSTSERDTEVCASILRNLADVAVKCERDAAETFAAGDQLSADDLTLAARRYRQLAARAIGNWADADALIGLTANAERDSAWDAETEAYASRDTEEMPRVH